nr:SapC family protein [uncultured Undibacterium sp.]
MSKNVLLNNVDHRDMRIILDRSTVYGDAVMSVLTFPAEFRDLQAHYPIVFRKTTDGVNFEPIALLGFQEWENLFLSRNGWDCNYIPMMHERLPFLIGRNGDQLMLQIDMENPKVNRIKGEALFDQHGMNTEFLERMSSMLTAIHNGIQSLPPFIDALLENDLLESFVVDVALNDGTTSRLAGFYTINEEKLNLLAGQVLESLNRAGYLQAIFMAVASMSNFHILIDRKNRVLSGNA